MAAKKELIKKVEALKGDQDFGKLSAMNKSELEQLVEYLEKTIEFEEKKSSLHDVDLGGDPDLEVALSGNEIPFEDLEKDWDSPMGDLEDTSELEKAIEAVEEPQELPESEWSVSDKRLFARTGRRPVKKK